MLHSELDMHAVTHAFRCGFNVSLQTTQVQRLHVPTHVKTPVDTYVLRAVCLQTEAHQEHCAGFHQSNALVYTHIL